MYVFLSCNSDKVESIFADVLESAWIFYSELKSNKARQLNGRKALCNCRYKKESDTERHNRLTARFSRHTLTPKLCTKQEAL